MEKTNHGGDKLKIERLKRIEERKKTIGSQRERKLQKYSSNFNMMFAFFLLSNRKGVLTFCGSILPDIIYDVNGDEGKYCFRKYENGQYKKGEPIVTRHPNIVKAVLTSKKSWGLFKDLWAEGIAECSFTKKEILDEFSNRGIVIPEPFIKEFEDFIWKKRIKFFDL